ncbi:MAG: hypothetical protein ACI9J2_002629, partial [Saprospiraceae bacterium]
NVIFYPHIFTPLLIGCKGILLNAIIPKTQCL